MKEYFMHRPAADSSSAPPPIVWSWSQPYTDANNELGLQNVPIGTGLTA